MARTPKVSPSCQDLPGKSEKTSHCRFIKRDRARYVSQWISGRVSIAPYATVIFNKGLVFQFQHEALASELNSASLGPFLSACASTVLVTAQMHSALTTAFASFW